ncbi:alpha/beta fold hydrolase [Umezawaea endophytica]|uniref:Alpha/beta hydrolase n=1 Tax=Umezawaea endophytica TaxID=1654476 RepID=A0A9X3AFA2_9PSEU|nr:alpha/beta hydrolase [Umezawaea endophytica]MCS7476940.1 alpha/beta hydrolase [Umezawaea endophytica]
MTTGIAAREQVHRLTVAGYDFACRVRTASRPSPSTPIVLLGGALMDMHDWGQVEARLPADATVLTFDLPGFGSASRLDDVTATGYEIQAEAVLVALDHLGIGRVDLLGYCYGAGLACLLADRHADRVARVALSNVCEELPPETLELLTLAVDLVEQGRIAHLCEVICERTLGPRDRRALAEAITPGVQDALRLPHTAATLRRGLNAHSAVMRNARRITAPLLVVCGQHDVFTPARAGLDLAAGHGTARAVVLDTGHTPLLEDPEAFVAHVMGHFTSP